MNRAQVKWDSIRRVRLVGGDEVVRRRLVIKREHLGTPVDGMGAIQRYDIGRELVSDTRVGGDRRITEIIQDFMPREKTEAEIARDKIVAHVRATIAKYQAILAELEGTNR